MTECNKVTEQHELSVINEMKTSPRSRDRLEKLAVAQPVKKFPVFYGTQRFIAVFTMAPPLGLILSHINPVHTLTSYETHLNKILISTTVSPK
jgi:hypothetical protein